MKRPLSIHETAEAEINEGADFYDLESPGLGTAFIDEIQKVVKNISRFPSLLHLFKIESEANPLINFHIH